MQSILPLLIALCIFAPSSVYGILFPFSKIPAQQAWYPKVLLLRGETYQSIDPQLSKNGFTFGYWAIDGVRQQGEDGRLLTRVSSVIYADSNYTAHYYPDNEDSDGDGVKDWFEYRMFGDLSSSPTDDSDGDGFSTSARVSLGRMH